MDKPDLHRHIGQMAKTRPTPDPKAIRLSIRLDLPDGSRFGPGRAALLAALGDTGSITAAARALNMSYPKALRLIEEMNAQFAAPLVETYQGGPKRGGATVTPMGEQVRALYETLTHTADTSNTTTLNALLALC